VKFLIGARSVTDSVLIVFVVLLKNLHKAKQALLSYLIVGLEAVIAFKHEFLHCILVQVDKLFDIDDVVLHLEIVLVSEIEE
jgi:hypothetical protein